jgi:hypothetical protein
VEGVVCEVERTDFMVDLLAGEEEGKREEIERIAMLVFECTS